MHHFSSLMLRFGVIQNNTALKHIRNGAEQYTGFGVIQNNTALKLI